MSLSLSWSVACSAARGVADGVAQYSAVVDVALV
jgi:hypothetical protein